LEIWWAEGRFGQLPELAADLVRWKPDVLVTAGPYGLQAARRATTTIPIVFKEFVGAGGLMSYGTMQTDLYQRAAGHTQGSPWRQASRRSGGAAYKVRVRH
jgi:hypothetical protein